MINPLMKWIRHKHEWEEHQEDFRYALWSRDGDITHLGGYALIHDFPMQRCRICGDKILDSDVALIEARKVFVQEIKLIDEIIGRNQS